MNALLFPKVKERQLLASRGGYGHDGQGGRRHEGGQIIWQIHRSGCPFATHGGMRQRGCATPYYSSDSGVGIGYAGTFPHCN